uniref:Uncharacterized protein n=1 Tax=Avena sativa TaxID=4498 RepID=A0ACD5W617_AVESA
MASPGGGSHGAAPGLIQPSSSSGNGTSSNESVQPKRLTIQELDEITDNLSAERLIGHGAYGKVYRGVLDDEDIAVKVLHNNMSETKDEKFQHEFDNLMMLNHPNIVRLVGYCFETQRQHMDFNGRPVFAETTCRALCFEYMHKGSLKGKLYDESHGPNWKTRYRIIKGACEGLKYLHEGKGLREPIYHLDLKPDNILLDEIMTPKLADFGLSKLCGSEQTRVTQYALGTIGYMPPEYLHYLLVSNKVDIFSMGVVITKIIAGPDGPKRIAETSNQEFLDQVYENWRKRLEAPSTSSKILDAYCEQVSICTEIGLNSMQTERGKRPTIREIIDRLDETETMIEKAISWSANSCSSSMAVKSQRGKDEDLVKVEAFARNKAIHFTETCDKFPILVRVTGAPWCRAEEMPSVDVVLAFNLRMDWVIEMDVVKKVMMVLVDRLNLNDRLSFLFSGRTGMEHLMEFTYMSDHGRDVARLKIKQLVEIRDLQEKTYRHPVLPKAAEILRERGATESSSRAGCILHMWTGYTELHIDEQDISQEFPVHTIAVGYHLSPEMKHVADMTSGTYTLVRYYYEVKDNLELFFASELKSVSAITLQCDEGVTISSIASGRYHNLVSSDKQSATVFLRNTYAGEQKNFIVYFMVPPGKEKLVTIGEVGRSKERVGMDMVVLRPRRKCLPHEVAIHPKVAAQLLRIRLMEGIAKENQDLSRNMKGKCPERQ